MNKVTIVSGMVAVMSAFWAILGSYFEGLEFYRTSLAGTFDILSFLIVLLAIITFIFGSLLTVIMVLEKRLRVKKLVPLLILTALFFAPYNLPLPRFVDGLHDAVASKLDRERLVEMADVARGLAGEFSGSMQSEELTAKLGEKYQAELSMSQLPPKLRFSKDTFEVRYGNRATGHWGYAVVEKDECPFPRQRCRKVYDNVWVYQIVG